MKYNSINYFALACLARAFHFFVSPFIQQKDTILFIHKTDNSKNFNKKIARNLIGSSKLILFNQFNILLLTLIGKPVFFADKNDIKQELRNAFGRGVKVFKPKLVLHMQDSCTLSKAVKGFSGAKLVNIAHGVTGATHLFSVIDFDYYFVYGDSSIDHLKNNLNLHIKEGETTLIKTGPVMCEQESDLKLSQDELSRVKFNKYKNRILYSSSYTTSKEIQNLLEKTHKFVVEFAHNNPETLVCVTLHPVEKIADYWYQHQNIPNLLILPAGHNKSELAALFDLHITMASNSVIDFGLRNLDSVVIRYNDYADEYLQFSKYFTVCTSAEELVDAIKTYSPENSKLKEFLAYHCEYTDFKSFDRIIVNLNKILDGQELIGIPFKAD